MSSSWIVRSFLISKARVTLEESKRKNKRKVNLANLDLTAIPPFYQQILYHSSHLRELYLQQNQLTELSSNLGGILNQLEKLALDYNQLTKLPDSARLLTNLTYLNVSNNDLSQNGFPHQICSLINLQKLWANGIGISTVPANIHHLKKLQILGLRNNCLVSVPWGILRLKNLKWLTLENNQITQVPLALIRLRKLVHLNMNCNRITQLPDIWEYFPELKYIFIGYNELDVNAILIRLLQKLPKLVKAFVHGNPCSSDSPYQDSISHMTATNIDAEVIWTNDDINGDHESSSGSSTDEELKPIHAGVAEDQILNHNLTETVSNDNCSDATVLLATANSDNATSLSEKDESKINVDNNEAADVIPSPSESGSSSGSHSVTTPQPTSTSSSIQFDATVADWGTQSLPNFHPHGTSSDKIQSVNNTIWAQLSESQEKVSSRRIERVHRSIRTQDPTTLYAKFNFNHDYETTKEATNDSNLALEECEHNNHEPDEHELNENAEIHPDILNNDKSWDRSYNTSELDCNEYGDDTDDSDMENLPLDVDSLEILMKGIIAV